MVKTLIRIDGCQASPPQTGEDNVTCQTSLENHTTLAVPFRAWFATVDRLGNDAGLWQRGVGEMPCHWLVGAVLSIHKQAVDVR